MLSRFNVPLVSLQPEWKLISYAAQVETALIVSLGDSISYVAPIVDGKEIVFATKLLPVNGALVTERLIQLLADEGVGRFESMSEQNAIRILKEKHAFARDDVLEEGEEAQELAYDMPDGSTITIPKKVLSECVEVLFDATLSGYASLILPFPFFPLPSKSRSYCCSASLQLFFTFRDCLNDLCARFDKLNGIVEAALSSVMAVENAEIRKSLLGNIILCGGSVPIPLSVLPLNVFHCYCDFV